ncbi:MAG TPA: GNAT family N-acetyltransferase [Candidatus Nanopelagicaceae bacterium]|nr:GNAT family N-acetyltransferase [Candidatus Nanopelagicaceae bacterium]
MVIELVAEAELDQIRPLLLDLLQAEQVGAGETAPARSDLDAWLPRTRANFQGENHIFAARDGDRVLGFCWCVLFDPGTGLEGEVAELYVRPEARGDRLASRLVERAVELFAYRRVTFACVWTRPDNQAALRAYRGAGFAPTDQLILTWYP